MNNFFALLFRMRFINRWSLMKNSEAENVTQHSLEVAVIAHCLALIQKKRLGVDISPEKTAAFALYHDAAEIYTGDLPTPVKYFDGEITAAYKKIETVANRRLLEQLPDYLQDEYAPILGAPISDQPGPTDNLIRETIKAADKLAALIKCVNELASGNKEFLKAKISLEKSLQEMNKEYVEIFMMDFMESFYLTLDELE